MFFSFYQPCYQALQQGTQSCVLTRKEFDRAVKSPTSALRFARKGLHVRLNLSIRLEFGAFYKAIKLIRILLEISSRIRLYTGWIVQQQQLCKVLSVFSRDKIA
jgi:hypothetical protein